MSRALLVVDVQPTFCEGGGLPVEGGNDCAARIGAFVAAHADRYGAVVASQDWHVDPGDHWAAAGTEPDFVTSWPRHGAAGDPEAELHPALVAPLQPGAITAVVRKGMHAAAYSAFEGVVVADPDERGLERWLRDTGIDAVDVCGIATDHCDRATALDAVAAGFATRLLVDLTVGVAPDTTAAALDELAAAGVAIVRSDEVVGA